MEPPSFSPRALKFSHLQKLKAAVPSPAKQITNGAAADQSGALEVRKDVRGTLAKVEKRRDKEEFFNDANVKISRHQYARTLLRMREQISHYHSVGVFVEYMLRELKSQDDTDVASLAAAGTWALNLLAHQEVGGALEAISEALLPAIYCEYNPSELPYASAAIQVQLRDPTAIAQNPYFTHSMYVEQVRVDHKNVVEIHQALHRALKNNEGSRNYVLRTVEEKRRLNIRYHFQAWRQLTRRHRILELTNEKRQQRHFKANSDLRLRMAFSSWRLMVECSRTSFLTDRLNEVAFQLENAKNQFQLQCFRTDRLIQTTKDAKAELAAALAIEQSLKDNIAQLEDELQAREEAYTGRLTAHIKDAFLLVNRYRDALSLLHSVRLPVEGYLALQEDYEPPTLVDLTAEIEVADDDPMGVLVRWCNYAIKEVRKSTTHKTFTTIGPEFYSGEYYLIVLHFVFPELISLQPNKDSNIPYRLRRICEMAEECHLIHALTPLDFTSVREDRMIASLSELYRRYLSHRWRENAKAAAIAVSCALNPATRKDNDAERLQVVDEEVFHNFMEDCDHDLKQKEQQLVEQCVSEKLLTENGHIVNEHELRLVRERRLGAPIRVLSETTRRTFWKVSYKSLLDLRNHVNIGSEAQMKQVVVGSLQMVLKKKDDILSRIFYFFAGENAKTMSEVAFWRFVECNTFCTDTGTLNKETVSHILDRVISPQLEAAMKAASHGKSEMDLKTMMTVAQREIDIRHIQPEQFVLINIRLAAEFYRSQVSFVEGVTRFIEGLRIPSIEKLHPLFQEFYSPDVQHVMNFYCDDLLRIFFFYLKQQEQSKVARDRLIAVQDGGRFASLFSSRSYIMMFDDCRYVDNNDDEEESSADSDQKSIAAATRLCFATPEQIESGLAKVKAARAPPGATELVLPGAGTELTFTMFIESFAVFCHYWCPDPFVPLARKLGAFVGTTIRRLMKAHSSGTLVLGTPPNIGLDGGSKVNMAISSGM